MPSIDILAALELVAFLYFMRHIKLCRASKGVRGLLMMDPLLYRIEAGKLAREPRTERAG